MGQWGGILGLENGIVVAPMGPDITGPELVAAVANAGGLGLLRAPSQVASLSLSLSLSLSFIAIAI
jgi:NAD(P)H-dependent flavin oxidoreductase YrpB (nitropropane dioxygenase family)